VNEPPAAGVGLAGGVLLPIMAPPQGGLILFVYILLRNVTKWRVAMKVTFWPSGAGFCGFCLAAGGGEQLADPAHRLLGRRQLAEASQALGLQQLVFERG
jgi:hypothetical protein